MDSAASDLAWARRANPAAALFRIAAAEPLIVLALYSRAWIGWTAVVFVLLAVAAWWFAPRLAPPAAPGEASWAGLATRGERLWQAGRAGDDARTLSWLSIGAGVCLGAGVVGALFLIRPLAVLATALAWAANLLLAERLARLAETDRSGG